MMNVSEYILYKNSITVTFCQTNKYSHYFLSCIQSIYSQIHLHLNPSSSDSFIFCENSIIVALNQTMLNLPNSYPLTYSFANISNLFIHFSIQIFLVLFDPHPSHRHVSKLKSIRETREVLSLIPFPWYSVFRFLLLFANHFCAPTLQHISPAWQTLSYLPH